MYEIIEERKEVVACKQHCEGSTQTAKAPKRFLPKTGVTESFIANIIVSKFDDRQPLYHPERRLKSRFGIQLSRQNIARWIISSAAHHAMQVYCKLYAVEKKATSQKLNPDVIKQLRQKHAKPLLETFKIWLENKIGLVPQQSPILKAIRIP